MDVEAAARIIFGCWLGFARIARESVTAVVAGPATCTAKSAGRASGGTSETGEFGRPA
jgi:hypothetical protein